MATKHIIWRLHLKSPPKHVFTLLNTAEGRERFWCEKSSETDTGILFEFPNGMKYIGKVYERATDKVFKIDYFHSSVAFELEKNAIGGTDLTLTNSRVSNDEYEQMKAGWVSVLLNLKAVADFGIDLRNHDQGKTWDQGYVDN
ncbi:hypothetical protein FK220_018610 [Flavobacteriaceae bacterium TP-CH-4]|uniref:Activator of Hsp90 ATPase homologue 1/2-like C-terminal domain-containing protein n=1 Tax=Pelagihabitans pacificus TaxID=2696054 RepID=A0A967AWB2_9FLAO|nr:SRPBCC domain-containing protein [Pelagihabitans pacificus]NHF61373.1 hypothetical protein [Pelagihabitans pacificus]